MCILELSKVPIYEFHWFPLIFELHDYFKNKHSNKSRLSFTDTASLVYEIEIENVYDNFSTNKKMFNFSNYPTESKFYDDSIVLVVGRMKDEMGENAIEKFFGLRTKIYSILVSDSSRPWHDPQAIAEAHAQENGLGRQWKTHPKVKLHGLILHKVINTGFQLTL